MSLISEEEKPLDAHDDEQFDQIMKENERKFQGDEGEEEENEQQQEEGESHDQEEEGEAQEQQQEGEPHHHLVQVEQHHIPIVAGGEKHMDEDQDYAGSGLLSQIVGDHQHHVGESQNLLLSSQHQLSTHAQLQPHEQLQQQQLQQQQLQQLQQYQLQQQQQQQQQQRQQTGLAGKISPRQAGTKRPRKSKGGAAAAKDQDVTMETAEGQPLDANAPEGSVDAPQTPTMAKTRKGKEKEKEAGSADKEGEGGEEGEEAENEESGEKKNRGRPRKKAKAGEGNSNFVIPPAHGALDQTTLSTITSLASLSAYPPLHSPSAVASTPTNLKSGGSRVPKKYTPKKPRCKVCELFAPQVNDLLVTCASCKANFHQRCHIPEITNKEASGEEGPWVCIQCRMLLTCPVCQNASNLQGHALIPNTENMISCDRCLQCYHEQCMDMDLPRKNGVDGLWFCRKCYEDNEEKKRLLGKEIIDKLGQAVLESRTQQAAFALKTPSFSELGGSSSKHDPHTIVLTPMEQAVLTCFSLPGKGIGVAREELVGHLKELFGISNSDEVHYAIKSLCTNRILFNFKNYLKKDI